MTLIPPCFQRFSSPRKRRMVFSTAESPGNEVVTLINIGHFGKYHNTLCLSPQILHKHCFQFLLGIRIILRENKNNAYAKFEGTNKEHYGIFRSGLLSMHPLICISGLEWVKCTRVVHDSADDSC